MGHSSRLIGEKAQGKSIAERTVLEFLLCRITKRWEHRPRGFLTTWNVGFFDLSEKTAVFPIRDSISCNLRRSASDSQPGNNETPSELWGKATERLLDR